MSSPSGSGFNETSTEEGDTFHIYILSFSYGFLLVRKNYKETLKLCFTLTLQLVVLGHLVVRWQWMRHKASKRSCHYPGDKSFKCKVYSKLGVTLWYSVLGVCVCVCVVCMQLALSSGGEIEPDISIRQ